MSSDSHSPQNSAAAGQDSNPTEVAGLRTEVARLRKMLQAYEQINAYSERELVKANRMLAAYQSAQELSPREINQLQQQMHQSLRRPEAPVAAVESGRPASLEARIREAIDTGLSEKDEDVFARLAPLQQEFGERFYVEFFRLLTHLEFNPAEARVYWDDVRDHTGFLSRALGRAVPFRAALLDYFLVRTPLLRNPRIIEQHSYEDVVRTSLQDELTGLYNRRYLDRCLLREFRRAERHGHSVALIIFDIDDFKQYNDSFGHPAGDEVMRTIGGLLAATFREEDHACRYGGEEFVVVLPETDAAEAQKVAGRFLRAVRSTKFPNRTITLSGGIAAAPAAGAEPGPVFLAADQALYRAKHAGKNQVLLAE